MIVCALETSLETTSLRYVSIQLVAHDSLMWQLYKDNAKWEEIPIPDIILSWKIDEGNILAYQWRVELLFSLYSFNVFSLF